MVLLGGVAAAIVLLVLQRWVRAMQQRKEQKIAKEGTVPERHKELFHYTSISALKGILETNSLWATKTTHLNDQSEMELIWPPMEEQVIEQYEAEILDFLQRNPDLKEVINNLGGVDHIAKEDGSRIVGEMHLKLVGNDETPSVAPQYVVSFATHSSDSPRDEYHRANGMLSQWRAYGGDKPVAIVFDTAGIDKLLQAESEHFLFWPLLIGDAIYLETDLSLIERFPSLFSSLSACARNFIEPRDRESLQRLMTQAYDEASRVCALLKHFGFHEEQECRIVAGATTDALRELLATAGTETPKPAKEVRHRRGHSGGIPYVALFDDLGQDLPIKRIIVGPSRNQDAQFREVRELVNRRGIQVQKSETPYVGSA